MPALSKPREQGKRRPTSLLKSSSFDRPSSSSSGTNRSTTKPVTVTPTNEESQQQHLLQRQNSRESLDRHRATQRSSSATSPPRRPSSGINSSRVSSPSYSSAAQSVTSNIDELNTIPDVYISTIISGFGPKANLYRDVLKVPRTAPDRDIRIAYFKRGREVLAEEGGDGKNVTTSGEEEGNVSTDSKLRFQAVSMAYEIISNPLWKDHYLRHGLTFVVSCDDDNQSSSSWDMHSTSAASVPCSAASVNSRVRWSENVEELVFRKHPAENGGKRRKRKQKRKTKILLESKHHLEEHLAKLDEEAEQHFVTDLFDDFEQHLEASFDGLLRLVDGSVGSTSQQGSMIKDGSGTIGSSKRSGISNTSPKKRSVKGGSSSGGGGDKSSRRLTNLVQSESLLGKAEEEEEVDDDPSPFDEEGVDDARKWLDRLNVGPSPPPQPPLGLKETKPFDENYEVKESSLNGKPPQKQVSGELPLEYSVSSSGTTSTVLTTASELKIILSHTKNSPSSVEASLPPLPPRHRQVVKNSPSQWDPIPEQTSESPFPFDAVNESFSADRNNPFRQVDSNDPNEERMFGIEGDIRKQTSGKPQPNESDRFVPIGVGQNDDDIFAGLEEEHKANVSKKAAKFDFVDMDVIAVPAGSRLRTESPGNLSDLSGSVFSGPVGKTSTTIRGKGVPSDDTPVTIPPVDDDDIKANQDLLLQPTTSHSTVSSKEVYHSFRADTNTVDMAENGSSKCHGWSCEPVSLTETLSFAQSPKQPNPESSFHDNDSTIQKSDGEDGFLKYLLAYITALTTDCSAAVANFEWEETKEEVFKAFTIPEGDMDCMLKILNKEIGRTSSFVSAVEPVQSY